MMSVASVSHQMIWDGLEVMPVVEDDLALVGIVSRQDVMKAMQLVTTTTNCRYNFRSNFRGSDAC